MNLTLQKTTSIVLVPRAVIRRAITLLWVPASPRRCPGLLDLGPLGLFTVVEVEPGRHFPRWAEIAQAVSSEPGPWAFHAKLGGEQRAWVSTKLLTITDDADFAANGTVAKQCAVCRE